QLIFTFVSGRAVRLPDAAGDTLGDAGALDHRAYGTTPVQAAYGVGLWLPAPVTVEPHGRSRRRIERVDLSAALSGEATVEALRQAIAAALGDDLVELQLIDVYPGAGDALRPGSVTYRAIYVAERGAPREVWEQLRARIEELP